VGKDEQTEETTLRGNKSGCVEESDISVFKG
jgi:hypothetical protein